MNAQALLALGAGWGLLLALTGAPGCGSTEDEGKLCPAYACINAAVLSGPIAVPAESSLLEVRYCSEQACIDGIVDLEQLGSSGACTDDSMPGWGDGVCFTRSADGILRVEAQLMQQETGVLPPDGESYSLQIEDANSGQVIIDETRKADYETTARDYCHLCWRAEMSL